MDVYHFTVALEKEREYLPQIVQFPIDILPDNCNFQDVVKYDSITKYKQEKREIFEADFVFEIELRQDFDALGVFDVVDFIPYDFIVTGSTFSPFTRERQYDLSTFIEQSTTIVTGTTENNIFEVLDLQNLNSIQVGINQSEDMSRVWTGVISRSQTQIEYVVGGDVDGVGAWVNGTGVKYVYDLLNEQTKFEYNLNYDRTQIYSNTLQQFLKYEEKIGLVFDIFIDNDLNIDRGNENPNEFHLRLAELRAVEDIDEYNLNFFNING